MGFQRPMPISREQGSILEFYSNYSVNLTSNSRFWGGDDDDDDNNNNNNNNSPCGDQGWACKCSH